MTAPDTTNTIDTWLRDKHKDNIEKLGRELDAARRDLAERQPFYAEPLVARIEALCERRDYARVFLAEVEKRIRRNAK